MNTQKKSTTAVSIERSPFKVALTLALCALIFTSVLALVQYASKDRIEQTRQRTLLRQLNSLLGDIRFDNDLPGDTVDVIDPLLGNGKPHRVWRARYQGSPRAAVLSATAPNGYSGPIELLIGISTAGTLTGVRVVNHRETPGLGDAIDIERSTWVLAFDGQSLAASTPERWTVKKEGGDFDQFTGATITPRAVVGAVHSALLYFQANQESLFD